MLIFIYLKRVLLIVLLYPAFTVFKIALETCNTGLNVENNVLKKKVLSGARMSRAKGARSSSVRAMMLGTYGHVGSRQGYGGYK